MVLVKHSDGHYKPLYASKWPLTSQVLEEYFSNGYEYGHCSTSLFLEFHSLTLKILFKCLALLTVAVGYGVVLVGLKPGLVTYTRQACRVIYLPW